MNAPARRRLLAGLSLMLVALALAWLGALAWSGVRLSKAEGEFMRRIGPLAPGPIVSATPADDNARRWDDAASKIPGVDFLPDVGARPAAQAPAMRASFESLERLTSSPPDACVLGAGPVPPDIVAFIDAMSPVLEPLRQLGAEGASPHFGVETGPDVHLPWLRSTVACSELLRTHALIEAGRGHHEVARADLEAARVLLLGLREHPELVTRLIEISCAKWQAVVLRQVDAPTGAADDLLPADERERVIASWRRDVGVGLDRVRQPSPLARTVLDRCEAWLLLPERRVRAAASLESMTREAKQSLAQGACGIGWAPRPERTAPRQGDAWQALEPVQLFWPLRRAEDAALQIELTRIVLAARSARTADPSGRWPDASALNLASTTCPGHAWRHELTAGGALHVRSWSDSPAGDAGFEPPLAFVGP